MKKKKAPTSTVETDAKSAAPRPLEKVAEELIPKLQELMTLARCEQIVRSPYFNRDKSPIAIYPSDKKEAMLLLDFALQVGQAERSACLDLIARHVTPEALRSIREQVLTDRGPVAITLSGFFRWEPDADKWEPKTGIALA